MTPLVIGTGFLGRAVCDRFERAGNSALHTFHSRRYFADSVPFDLLSHELADVIDLTGIDVVVIPSKVEEMPDTVRLAGAMGRLFDQCRDKRVVYVSSDAVFDGRRGRYRETDRPNPGTAYGRHKALCERLLKEKVRDHCILRTSYIYGFSLGQLDDRLSTIKALAMNGRSVRKYVDMYKSPVDVNQLADIVLAACDSDFTGVLHACGTRMSVHEFFRLSLEALDMDATCLEADRIPENPAPDCLFDTSLDCNLLKEVFGMQPVSVTEALKNHSPGNTWPR